MIRKKSTKCPCSGSACEYNVNDDICGRYSKLWFKRGYERCAWINKYGKLVEPEERLNKLLTRKSK